MQLAQASRWLNCFQYCSKALKVLGHIMVLMVLGLITVSYYTVVAVHGPAVMRSHALQAVGSALGIAVVTILAALMAWSYMAAVVTDPGKVPPGWHPFADEQQARHELERMAYADYYFDRRDPRRPRFCKRCQAWKPERAHHCSVMGRCVLKMDHFCVWATTCIGLLNYKFFLLFLMYTFLACLVVVALLIQPLVDFFSNHLKGPMAPLVFVVVVTDGAFAVSLLGFLVMHFQLLAANCTSIEMYEKDRIHPWPYNKGLKKNLEEVFGRSRLRWFLPLNSKEEKRALLDSCLNTRLLPASFPHSTFPHSTPLPV